MRRLHVAVLVSILLGCLVGCGSPQNLRVTDIQIGRSLNADNSVREHATSFAPSDTVCLSVLTAGAGSGTISVRWTYAGRVVDEPKKPVSYRDVAATDFRLQGAGGLPAGEYTAEVFLEGQPAGSRTFRVQ